MRRVAFVSICLAWAVCAGEAQTDYGRQIAGFLAQLKSGAASEREAAKDGLKDLHAEALASVEAALQTAGDGTEAAKTLSEAKEVLVKRANYEKRCAELQAQQLADLRESYKKTGKSNA